MDKVSNPQESGHPQDAFRTPKSRDVVPGDSGNSLRGKTSSTSSESGGRLAPNAYLDSLLTEREAAAFLRFTPRALQEWRRNGRGPAFVKISARAVRYRLRDLLEWTEERVRHSTGGES